MILNSKFRALFLARKVFIFCGLLFSCYQVFSNKGIYLIVFVALLLLFIFLLPFELINFYKIVISKNGITKVPFLFYKEEFINFSDIESVTLNHNTGFIKHLLELLVESNISEGYYESIINLKNKKQIIVSPDYFENYRELVVAMSENFTNYEEE